MGELVSAQGAVNSLLSHAYGALAKEVKLVRGVRGDVQFIKDEMESMHAFLLKIAEGNGDDDHQVRAWMNQVKEVADRSEYYVRKYLDCLDSGGGDTGTWCGPVGRIARFLATIPSRRKLATRIHELKARAQEVGERQQRYGVTALPPPPPPPSATNNHQNNHVKHEDDGDIVDEERHILVEVDDSDLYKKAADEIIRWMEEDQHQQQEEEEEGHHLKPKVIPILGPRGAGRTTLAHKVCHMYCSSSSSTSTSMTNCKPFWISLEDDQYYSRRKALETILAATCSIDPDISMNLEDMSSWEEIQILETIRGRLRGKRFLVVLDDVPSELPWSEISDAFHSGDAILLVTSVPQVANSCHSRRIFDLDGLLAMFFLERAVSLLATGGKTTAEDGRWREVLISILTRCSSSLFAMEMFLRSLYVNPDRKIEELSDLCNSLDHSSSASASATGAADNMLTFCYHSLPSHYANCLAYLACFPKDYSVRRTSLVRRWLAEGLISRRDVPDSASEEALDVANRCFDALCAHKFLLCPADAIENDATNGGGGRFKRCTVHGMVCDFLSSVAQDKDVVHTELFPNKADRIGVQNFLLQLQASGGQVCSLDSIANHLESLVRSSSLELLNVLDLEGFRGFAEEESRYLKIICTKAIHLRYLSLRDTDVSKLPKQIQNLQKLETLDIRGTRVKVLDVVLPMLKHLHSGQSEWSSVSVRIPRQIRRMTNIEVMSNVDISNRADEVMCLGQLLRLRKLGVVVTAEEASLLKYVFSQIERHKSSLRSLSITIDGEVGSYNLADSYMLSPPRLLQNLSIRGSRGRLPHWVAGLHQLAKITLRETYLTADAMQILGKLHGLRCLRFLTRALTERTIKFIGGEFSNLVDLLLQQNYIRSVIFDHGTAPKLERVVFDVEKMTTIHGILHLPSLKHLKIFGYFSGEEAVRKAIDEEHPNRPRFSYEPPDLGMGYYGCVRKNWLLQCCSCAAAAATVSTVAR